MRNLSDIFVFVFLMVGCGSKQVAVPFLTKPPQSSAQKVDRASPKALSGRVTFSDLSPEELARIRVIPEQGKELFQPENRTYDQVDGFWWQGDGDLWFKIPDLSEAWVGRAPEQAAQDASRGDLTVYHRTRPVLGMMESLGTVKARPSWVPDEGKTRSPVGRPEF